MTYNTMGPLRLKLTDGLLPKKAEVDVEPKEVTFKVSEEGLNKFKQDI